jgi:hypothetical protein
MKSLYMKRLRLAAVSAAAAAMLAACFDRLASGGDATETGNARVSGVVRGEDGRSAVGAEVVLVPSDFNPAAGTAMPDSLKDTTDAEGRYRFDRTAAGEYNVLALDRAARTRLSVWGVRLGQDPVEVPDATLHIPGTLSIPVPESADSGAGWIFVPGTLLRVRVDSETRASGWATLDSVPAGVVPGLAYANSLGDAPKVIARDVAVGKGKTAAVDAYDAWPHSSRLTLNTAAGATALAKDLYDFPLLVRLAAPAFDFSQAAADGSDLRFSAPDGSPLPREIESWDRAAGKAAIWVRLDTLHAGRAAQAITMHWGASPAAGPMRKRPVFDTLKGFAGVWHLAEEAADTVSNRLFRDATGGGSDGDDRIRNVSRAGAVGAGHGLDSGDYIQAPKPSMGLKLTRAFTLSAWFRTDGKKIGTGGGELLSIGDNFGLRVQRDSGLQVWYWPPGPPPASGVDWYYVIGKSPALLDGQWHLAAGVFDGSVLRIYCDGKELGSSPAADVVGHQFPLNATLGKHGNGKRMFEYAGDLDEARIHSLARSEEWIRMEFENQKPESAFPASGP